MIGYWWLFYCKLLLVILCYIYYRLLYSRLLMDILTYITIMYFSIFYD
jgi:hypothetical protein